MTTDDYVWSPPRVGKTLAQLEREVKRRRVWSTMRSCLWVPFLWIVGIVVPVALTIVFGSLWVLVLYVVVMAVVGTAYWQGQR